MATVTRPRFGGIVSEASPRPPLIIGLDAPIDHEALVRALVQGRKVIVEKPPTRGDIVANVVQPLHPERDPDWPAPFEWPTDVAAAMVAAFDPFTE